MISYDTDEVACVPALPFPFLFLLFSVSARPVSLAFSRFLFVTFAAFLRRNPPLPPPSCSGRREARADRRRELLSPLYFPNLRSLPLSSAHMNTYTLPLFLSLLLFPQEEYRLCTPVWKIRPPGQRGPPWDAPKQPDVEHVMPVKRMRRARFFFDPSMKPQLSQLEGKKT